MPPLKLPRRLTVHERIQEHLTGLISAALLCRMPLLEFEDILRKRVIEAALRNHKGCISRAARDLKMDRDTLRLRMYRLGIPLPSRAAGRRAA